MLRCGSTTSVESNLHTSGSKLSQKLIPSRLMTLGQPDDNSYQLTCRFGPRCAFSQFSFIYHNITPLYVHNFPHMCAKAINTHHNILILVLIKRRMCKLAGMTIQTEVVASVSCLFWFWFFSPFFLPSFPPITQGMYTLPITGLCPCRHAGRFFFLVPLHPWSSSCVLQFSVPSGSQAAARG